MAGLGDDDVVVVVVTGELETVEVEAGVWEVRVAVIELDAANVKLLMDGGLFGGGKGDEVEIVREGARAVDVIDTESKDVPRGVDAKGATETDKEGLEAMRTFVEIEDSKLGSEATPDVLSNVEPVVVAIVAELELMKELLERGLIVGRLAKRLTDEDIIDTKISVLELEV